MVRCESRFRPQVAGAVNIWSGQRNTVNTSNGVRILFRCIRQGISGVIAQCVYRVWTRSSHRVIRRSRKARGLALQHRPLFHDGTSRSSVHRLRPALAFLKALDMETRSLLIRASLARLSTRTIAVSSSRHLHSREGFAMVSSPMAAEPWPHHSDMYRGP